MSKLSLASHFLVHNFYCYCLSFLSYFLSFLFSKYRLFPNTYFLFFSYFLACLYYIHIFLSSFLTFLLHKFLFLVLVHSYSASLTPSLTGVSHGHFISLQNFPPCAACSRSTTIAQGLRRHGTSLTTAYLEG